MKNYLAEITKLIFPPQCPACQGPLPMGSKFICPSCLWNIPTTGYETTLQNPVYQKLSQLADIKSATSTLFFTIHSPFQTMIHALKFHGQWKLSRQLGELMGDKLNQGGILPAIDLILPIPLHHRRLIGRGYNQSYYLAEGISRMIHAPVSTSHLKRQAHTRPQSSTPSEARWENVKGIFTVRHPEALSGKRILLIDDVLTTGSTLIACCEAIHHHAPDCEIHIATLAVSRYQLFKNSR